MRVRALSIYIGSVPIAEMSEATITFKANGELVVVVNEVVKTKGVTTTEFTAETLTPVEGYTVDMVGMLLLQSPTVILLPIANQFYSVKGTFDEVAIKTMIKSGMTTASFKWSGGSPQPQSLF